MPKFARRSYAKKRPNKKGRPTSRRLLGRNAAYGATAKSGGYRAATPAPTSRPGMYNLRGSYGQNAKRGKTRGRSGAAKPDAASGGVNGFRVNKLKRMGGVLKKRQRSVLSVLANSKYPVIKDHQLLIAGQIDWASGIQGIQEYGCGYTTDEIEAMLNQANYAQTANVTSIVAPASTDTLLNQRMDVYDKIVKFNFKNTCSHTVYLDIRAYTPKTYHGYTVLQAWQLALNSDNMLQTPASFGTEETQEQIGCRPQFKFPDLSVRWKENSRGRFKITLEPGQETSYTYVQKGGRFDQQKFNVLQGNSGTADDITYIPGMSSSIVVYARSEMVADALDTDVTYGSGHIACNKEVHKSWAAVPYIKPYQASFTNNWGTVVEANELDLNQYQANNDVYEEQV